MRQLCVHRDMKYAGSLESTQEARVAPALLRIFRALQTSRVLHISMNARWRMNQLLINIQSIIYFFNFILLSSYS